MEQWHRETGPCGRVDEERKLSCTVGEVVQEGGIGGRRSDEGDAMCGLKSD